MKKLVLMVVAAMIATVSAYADATYTTKQVVLNRIGVDDGTVTLRFYNDMPSVPYISVADFQQLMLSGTTINVTKTGDGTYTLTGPYATATVNTTTDQFASDDYMAFTNLMSLVCKEGMDNVYLDGVPYVRYKCQELTPASASVTFDFKKYGIDLHGDDEAVYFPLATLSDLYSDLHNHNVGYNGEKVVVLDHNNPKIYLLEPTRTTAQLEQTTRAADMADFCYKELCFTVDHFYGMPGRSPYEDVIKEHGLNKALSENLIANGADIKKLLKSTNMQEYVFGMNCMTVVLCDGGHTYMWVDFPVYLAQEPNTQAGLNKWVAGIQAVGQSYRDLAYSVIAFYNTIFKPKMGLITQARTDKGIQNLTYYKEGDTAYLLFPSFGPTNFPAWDAYYAGGCQGSTPAIDQSFMGDLSVVLDAMKQANDDPEVKKLIIDLSLNTGGSLDVLIAMTALMNGQSYFTYDNILTGQKEKVYYDVDCNFDGVFDENDKEVWKSYDLKYGVMTSDVSFSCANLFPSLMKDAGFPIIGEKSGGGACGVQYYITPEGLQFQMSSARARLTDQNGQNIDAGVTPTYPIDDYASFYDVPTISNILDVATGIGEVESSRTKGQSNSWYTLDGRRLNAQPTTNGIYLSNGKKVVVK